MTRLLLFRHAKAVSAGTGGDDFDRALAPRGHRDAALMADWLCANDLHPRQVICSAARRTRETLAGLLPALADDCETRLTPDLYEADERAYLSAIAEFGGTRTPLLVVGHNPAIHETALDLIADRAAVAVSPIARGFPTAALAVVEFDIDAWHDLKAGSGRLVGFTVPRDLAAGSGGTGSERND